MLASVRHGKCPYEPPVSKAIVALRSALADGPRYSCDVHTEVHTYTGASRRTIERARRLLGVVAYQFSENSSRAWVLALPANAIEASMSKRQAVTAIRVANVPDEEFEADVESDELPTVTELAEPLTKQRTHPVLCTAVRHSNSNVNTDGYDVGRVDNPPPASRI
jgi:hypothetical protein